MLLVYGSYGYTGRLVVEECERRGVEIVVAGRNPAEVEMQEERWGFEGRVFTLDGAEDGIEGADSVLNCAGPFSKTHDALVGACLEEGADYLDITGEIDVFESIACRDGEARASDVTLVPGVGFDVVPSDCLAAYLADGIEEPSYLALALRSLASVSPGTARTVVESLGKSGVVRRDGDLREVPPAWKTRRVDFGDGRGKEEVTTMPLGDVVTAYRSAGVDNIECYVDLPRPARALARSSRYLSPLLRANATQSLLKTVADAVAQGPDEEERVEESGHVWGEVRGKDDQRKIARLRTPEPYALTAQTATAALESVEDADAGYQTPATAFGADFVVDFDGVEREEVEVSAEVEVDA